MGRSLINSILTFLGGLYFVLYFFLPSSWIEAAGISSEVHEKISTGFILIGAVAFGVGLINLFAIHGRRIAFRSSGYTYSGVLLIGMVGMISLSGIEWGENLLTARRSQKFETLGEFAEIILRERDDATKPPFAFRVQRLRETSKDLVEQERDRRFDLQGVAESLEAKDRRELLLLLEEQERVLVSIDTLHIDINPDDFSEDLAASYTTRISSLADLHRKIGGVLNKNTITAKVARFLGDGLFTSLGSAMFSLLGVYIASAAYRAFRIKTFEATLMMGAALIVMLGQIPFGIWLYDGFPEIRLWLMQVPNAAAFRAIKIGALIAGFILAFRMWLSLDKQTRE